MWSVRSVCSSLAMAIRMIGVVEGVPAEYTNAYLGDCERPHRNPELARRTLDSVSTATVTLTFDADLFTVRLGNLLLIGGETEWRLVDTYGQSVRESLGPRP